MKASDTIQPGDMAQLTTTYEIVKPDDNDGSKVTLPAGWQREFIRFINDGESAQLWYTRNPDVPITLPSNLIAPVKKTGN
jgi:hypothetical protein